MVRVKHILWLFLVSWTLIACQQEKYDRSGDDTNSLLSIEDSMEANPRFVRQKIDDGMKKAPDSLTYYEYMSRLGKFFVLSSSPDSMPLYINPVVAFAEHQPESPRRNSLLAYAYNCQAIIITFIRREKMSSRSIIRHTNCSGTAIPQS